MDYREEEISSQAKINSEQSFSRKERIDSWMTKVLEFMKNWHLRDKESILERQNAKKRKARKKESILHGKEVGF